MNNSDDVFKEAMTGIKRRKRRVVLSRFNLEDGIVSDAEEYKGYVPGKGIIHIQDIKAKILDCGHSAGLGLGHICSHGHTVCAVCVEAYVLMCARCFEKLCTVEDCPCCAHEVDNVYFCRSHSTFALAMSFGSFLIMGPSKAGERFERINMAYYSGRLKIRDKR